MLFGFDNGDGIYLGNDAFPLHNAIFYALFCIDSLVLLLSH